MKLQSVIDDDQLIAEFMGATSFEEDHTEGNESYCKEMGIDKWFITIWTKPEGFKDEWGWGKYTLGKWEYNSSWDWLMPVVDKIETNFFDITNTRAFKTRIKEKFNGELTEMLGDIFVGYDSRDEYKGWYCTTNLGCMPSIQIHEDGSRYETRLEATYKAVVEFIKWFNESKNN